LFVNGHAGKDPVINFRVDKNQLANNCRVTNCVIDDFNNPKRMDENNWVLFYGKNNALDHCSFVNKKNMGVLLAVILDDDRSRVNFHNIEYNYFGKRIPLASNGGEIIRVGVSQHCQFSSSTMIRNNFFEQCDGETEIISIKSGHNAVQGNVFKECQGSVVLRHGDSNVVVGNSFIGNNKAGTGGVRVINRGQQVSANVFYKCRGTDFRSPMAIMNGIPNSPAIRYVQVTDAQINSNIFYECAPLSFCEGSDTERTLPPDKVAFAGNVFYNNNDSNIFRASDNIGGFQFANNKVSSKVQQQLPDGFDKTTNAKADNQFVVWRIFINKLPSIEKMMYSSTGAAWFPKKTTVPAVKPLAVNCSNAGEVYKQLATKTPLIINLTGSDYVLDKPFVITKNVRFTNTKNTPVKISTGNMLSAFVIGAKGNLSFQRLTINGANVKAVNFISNDSTGSSDHYNLSVTNCTIQNLDARNGCENLFHAYKYMIADSLVFRNNSFLNNNCNGMMMEDEKDNKGYYSAEKVIITQNKFDNQNGTLLDIYRGGNDESTMGPILTFSNNKTTNSMSEENTAPLIHLFGVQRSSIEKNVFVNCNTKTTLIRFEDAVRATHQFKNNELKQSGSVSTNKFVQSQGNLVE
jgi:poly(beta-D-mannuronate) lyase